jgi:pimeloyl-ACP methyl ester carboxylesterase
VRTLSLSSILAVVVAAAFAAAPAHGASAADGPTIVLVHGAWEQGSSWSAVVEQLRGRGYRVIVPELPLRRLADDAAHVADVLHTINGPVVLVGHSYGGAVISNAAVADQNVAALVFIAAFAPDRGESILGLDVRDPGSLVAASLLPVPSGADVDLFVNPLLYRQVFAGDVAAPAAASMADAQRPLTLKALTDPSAAPAWTSIASWYLVASDDLAIPPATERFMAARAHATTVEIASSHAAHVAHPDAVTDLIAAAAAGAEPPPPPAVARLVLSRRAFRAARSGPAVKEAAPESATRVSYVLDQPASVRFTVERLSPGRSAGGRCASPAAGNRRGRACTRAVAVRGDFTRARQAGADSFTFTARVAGRTLSPGRYRLVATPTAGDRTGAPAHARFRIVR